MPYKVKPAKGVITQELEILGKAVDFLVFFQVLNFMFKDMPEIIPKCMNTKNNKAFDYTMIHGSQNVR